jgi:hypothetical protein
MTITLEITKKELDLILRGISNVLTDEVDRGTRRNGAYRPTKNFQAAEALEIKLTAVKASPTR